MSAQAAKSSHPSASWHFILLLNIALAAFYVTTQKVEAPCALLLVTLSQVTRHRLPRSRALAAALRLGIFTAIVMHLGIPAEPFPQWYLKPAYTVLIGCLLAAESAIRVWEPIGGRLSGDPRGVIFFVSALLMAVAANTADRSPINYFAPIYIAAAIVALRSFEHRRPTFSVLQLARIGLLGLVLAAGNQLVRGINQYDEALNNMVERLLFQHRRAFQVGMSPSPRLGWIFNPLQQADRVMLVEGSLTERYLAAAEFDHYLNRQWDPSVSDRPYVSVDPRSLRSDSPGTKLTFTRVGADLNLLPMPTNVNSVIADSGVEQDDFGGLRHTEPNLTGAASQYAAVIPPDDQAQGPLTPPLTGSQRKTALELPENFDPAAIALSRRFHVAGSDENTVMRLQNYLQSTHGYSLVYHPSGNEAISNFILKNESAHCVYFASALVMMCRADGIPARLVTGYYAWEYYSENTLVVRSRDAHAWVEAWIDGVGWMRFDATPSSGRPDALNQPTSWIQRTWEQVTDWPGKFRDWISQFSESVFVALFIGLAATLFLFFAVRWLWLQRAARLRSRASRYAIIDRQLMLAAKRFQRWLAQRGNRCENSQSWRQCLGDYPDADAFLIAYERARFGNADEQATREALRQLRILESRRVSVPAQSAITAPQEATSRGR